ncbi:MAG: CusA/CzcA family heavy metal efflux RND transporter [Pseudomonadales bacterium]|nr:CusA/CzcA family heavy metal efflux RND transporter [Pseudomonadales bacterium]
MISLLIRWSVNNPVLIAGMTLFLLAAGIVSLQNTPVDALPDVSDTQVIIRTSFPGQAPQLVEDQVTYPLSSRMLAVPGAVTVRGFSFFGDSYVYVLFDDDTDQYWARSRVLETLSQMQDELPESAQAALGPDATGVGWVYQYALIDRSGNLDLSDLRSLQDWFLKFELSPLPGVAEVASIGGMVRQYQVIPDPIKLANLGITHQQLIAAVNAASQETGGSIVELGGAEMMVRARGYLSTLDEFRLIPLALIGTKPVLLGDVAEIRLGAELRRGVAELNGEGEVVGGVIIVRAQADARQTIAAVNQKLDELRASLPPGVEIVTTYNRATLIDGAINNLSNKLIEELLLVVLICGLFLWHLRSALVVAIFLPLGVLLAFALMRMQGVNANILSLGGIAIAIGTMIDAAIVMIENAHKRLEQWQDGNPDWKSKPAQRREVIIGAAAEVGPALFFSLLIITLSFLPVFALQAQEGRLFSPLAFTKTYAMAIAAMLSVTLVPVLMTWLIKGRIHTESSNPLNRLLTAIYLPVLQKAVAHPLLTLSLALLLSLSAFWPASQLGGEFLPPLDEGDLLYMPTALPGLPAQQASDLLQLTNRMIRTIPEVATVFGKAGRADSATDPAPLAMFETNIHFKPRAQWRPGMTPEKLIEEMDRIVRVPGLSNVWIPPIRNRIDMLSTGVKSPIGIRVSGDDLNAIDAVTGTIERLARQVAGVSSAVAERIEGGRYIDVDIDRQRAAQYGLSMREIQSVVSSLTGGANVGEVIAGRARYPINVRYPQDWRNTLQRLEELPILSSQGTQLRLGTLARISVSDGPAMLKSENARPVGWVYIDVRGRDLASTVADLQTTLSSQLSLPPGISISYSGQFEALERANERLQLVIPATLLIITMLLYLTFKRIDEALLILFSLPFALTGGVWLLYLMGHNLSVASAIGFIALAGVSAEFGIIMLVYLKQAWQDRVLSGASTQPDLHQAILEGAAMRLRPKMMTAATIVAGLLPILIGSGTGSEIMSRIAAPMVGGMVTAPLLSLLVLPAAYSLLRRRECATAQPPG